MRSGEFTKDHIRIRTIATLAEGRYTLRKYTVDYLRRNGTWQQLSREVYNRGDSAVVLLYCRSRGTIVLTRQFRFPVFVNGPDAGTIVEAPGGLLDGELPAAAILRETKEETGIHLEQAQEVFVAYMNPGLLTERTHFFVAEYGPSDFRSPGGGCESEGEDIEVFEVSFATALTMFQQQEIVDAKTILLLLYAKTQGLLDNGRCSSDNI